MVTTVVTTANAFLRPYAERMRGLGWQVFLATSDLEQRPGITASFDGVIQMPWRRSIWHFRANITALHKMRSMLQSGQYDVVHTHTPIASFLTRLACIGLGRTQRPAIIYTAHGFHFHRNGELLTNVVYQIWEKLVARWTDYLVVINQEDRERAMWLRLVRPERIILMPGIGIELRAYAPRLPSPQDKGTFRTKLGIPAAAPVITMIAEFSPGKRHGDLLAAVATTAWNDWHIIFAGEGRTLEQTKHQVHELGLTGRTHFLGFCEDVAGLLRESNVTALPSEREGLPRAIMESMAAGVPVVGADSRGIRDLLSDDCGVLHPVGDIEKLRVALERVIYSPALQSCLTANAADRIKAYELRPLLELHQRLYERVAVASQFDEPALHAVVAESPTGPRVAAPEKVLVIGAALGSLAVIRSPVIRDIRAAGLEVLTVASDRDAHAEATLRAMGIRYIHIPMARTGIAPVTDGLYCLRLTRLIAREEIGLILAYTHKPVIYASLAKAFVRRIHHVRCFALITGLGYAFTDDERNLFGKRFVRRTISWLYRVATAHLEGIMFQNHDDIELFGAQALMPRNLPSLVVRGSGVDVERYIQSPARVDPLRFVFIARLLSYKGVREFAAAAALLKQTHPHVVCSIVGPFDPNPSGITSHEMSLWQEQGIIRYEGATDDVRPFLDACSVYVLPSYYREGTPRTILEAMSIGRPIITADTPGCRETIFDLAQADTMGVRRGRNGFLVPPRSVEALTAAMRCFVEEPELAVRMGMESRRLAEQHYDVRIINQQMLRFMGVSSRKVSS
jgi:glycosyltransferase involved in cell wall biosynthesis